MHEATTVAIALFGAGFETTANIIGNASGAVHRNPGPTRAPALAYVPIAEGSSAAAPVTMPSPSARIPPRSGSRAPTSGFIRGTAASL